MYDNILRPIDHLRKIPVVHTGGLCWIIFFKWEDVALWPEPDPQSGIIFDPVVLKPGKVFYAIDATQSTRIFSEQLKRSAAGPYVDMEVGGTLAGNSLHHILTTAAMAFHDYGVLLREHNGLMRLLGNADSGCRFEWVYTSGTLNTSRLRTFKFTWEGMLPAAVYHTVHIIADGQLQDINTQKPVEQSSELTMLIEFEVGAVGSPMGDGDSTYTSPGLIGKKVMVFISEKFVHPTPNANRRYLIKAKESNTMTIVGGVAAGETVSIYTLL